ncbi:hypothetical protein ACVQK1_00370 [Edwardsiella tarda]
MRKWSGSCPHPLNSAKSTLYAIHQPSGHEYTRDEFNRRWGQAKKTVKEQYPELNVNFTFHDLNTEEIADLKGNIDERQAISGNKNAEQTARCKRKIPIVPTVDGQ